MTPPAYPPPGVLVLHLGPALEGNSGGMATVIRQLLEHQRGDPEIETRHIITAYPPGRSLPAKLLLAATAGARLTLRCLRRPKPILHVHAACRGSLTRKSALMRLGRVLGARIVLHVHGAEFDEWYAGSGPRGQVRIRRILNRADVLIAVADYWNDFLSRVARSPVETVRNTIDTEAFPIAERDRPSPAVNLLFLGLVGERKGTFELIRALRRALDAPPAPDLKLVVAGNGELERAAALARELGLADRVEIAGWIGPEEKLRRLREADVFVLPTHHEGLPMALLEAMSTGLPAVTTPVGGIPEVVRDGETGLLVAPGNVAALTGAVVRLAADPDLRRRLGAAAAAEVRKFDLEAACARIKQIYLRLADRH
mgnify:CR=1 FL=1